MNTIRIYLAESGRIADIKKDFPLYQGQFQNKLLNVYVPTSILAPDFTSQAQDGTVTEFVASTGVKIGVTSIGRDGAIKKGKTRYMRYLKTLTHQGVEYALYERKMPKEFTLYAGQGANAPTVAINIVNIQLDADNKPQILSVITSQECKLDVMPSSLLDADEMIENDDELLKLSADINEALELLEEKQNVYDERLKTNSKHIVFAINENKSNIDANRESISTANQEISSNRDEINKIKEEYSMAEEYIGTYRFPNLPSDTTLTDFVINKAGRQPKNGDVVIFVLDIDGETDKNYKYVYSKTGWSGYEIPPIETAKNGSLGIIEGTYGVGIENETLVDISGGKIVSIWVKDNLANYRNIKEYLNTTSQDILDIILGDTVVGEAMKSASDGFGNNIYDTYLTKSLGATKQYVRDYAMPREFNDVSYIGGVGFVDEIPSNMNGIFTTTTNAVGDFTIFDIWKNLQADFELSSNNGYKDTIYISSNKDCKVTFRLTTQYKTTGEDWQDLNIELTSPINLTAGDIEKITFSSNFAYLNKVLKITHQTNDDYLRQVLEVITQTSEEIVFNIYSNITYPSTFYLTSQSYTLGMAEENSGNLIMLGVDGIIEANKVVFTVQDAESFEEYKTNQREFLINGNLPIVGELDDTLPVYITFGNTTYGVFSYMKGSATPITIGDLKSNMTYSAEIGYSFTSKMIYLETSDYRGFVISPVTITAEQLANILEDTETVVVSLNNNGTKLNVQLSAEIVNKLAKVLITPMTKPAKTELVGVDSQNMQTMIELGDGLTLENGVLKASATGGVTEEYVQNKISGLFSYDSSNGTLTITT